MEHKMRFITFEGIDCCGKTTQIKKVGEYLAANNIPHVVEKEPGSTALGGALRRLLKEPEKVYAFMNVAFAHNPDFSPLLAEQERTPEAELHLFLAARADFIKHIVRLNFAQGKSVIADRFIDSTTAYQGGGFFYDRPEAVSLIETNHYFLLRGLMPNLTFLLDISYEDMQRRGDPAKKDYFERRGEEYYGRVRATYLDIARRHADRVVLLDGTQSIDDIFHDGILPHIKRIYNLS